MATPGGTPPTGDSPKPKREFTPEQKRNFAGLGVVGVLALVAGVMYIPAMLSGGGGTAAPVAPVAPPAAGGTGADATNAASPVTAPTTGAGAGLPGATVVDTSTGGTAAGTGAGTAGAQPVVFISQSRTDPFQPVYIIPPPAPTPTPLPPPDPRISIPAPPGFENGINLPSIKDPAVRAAVAAPLRIGLPIIPGLDRIKAPRDAFPLPLTGPSGGGVTGGAPQQSYDKRLAGIIIGDGVRALLELPSGEQRVVQPGDEIEGIRILNIERFRQGDRTVTRMLVRDTDGSQRYVELKPSTQAQQAAGGEGGLPGAFGGPTGAFGVPR